MRPSGQPLAQQLRPDTTDPLPPPPPGSCDSNNENDKDIEMTSTAQRRNARHSRFTRRHLTDMAAAVTSCPLRVVAHIDLDAYYAQCEMLRLGVDDDTPLAVQQWRNLIAVNYPARAFGIGRMVTAVEARRLCPGLVLQHVPTWKEGETQWAYHADADKAMQTHKVSLEPYRIRSREILATIKASLPAGRCRIEKAGIDEVFIDLSACVHDVLVHETYPELLADDGDASSHGPDDPLPPPPAIALDWAATGSGVIQPDTGGREERPEGGGGGGDEMAQSGVDDDPPDWDDVAMLEGARIVRAVRMAIYDHLRFRCSAGIASNKLVSKLGSSQHKPDRQTVVRPRAVGSFLERLSSVTRLRGLGGKLGARVVAAFDTESIAELRTIPLAEMQSRLAGGGAGESIDADTARHVYGMLRGIDHGEVTSRTEIKSLISAKSFQPPLTSPEQGRRWLRVFAAELRCRLLDERLSQALLEAVSVGRDADEAQGEGEQPGTTVDTSTALGGFAGTTGPPGPGTPATFDAVETWPGESDGRSGGQQLSQTRKDQMQVQTQVQTQTQTQTQTQRSLPPRLPQTIRLHHGALGHWRSRQMRIPRDGSPLDEEKLLRLGIALLDQAHRQDSVWPCPHLAMSLNGFEEPPALGNKSIAAFFRLKAAPEMQGDDGQDGQDGQDDRDRQDDRGSTLDSQNDWPLAKRRRTTPGVSAMFAEDDPSSERPAATSSAVSVSGSDAQRHSNDDTSTRTFRCDRCHDTSFATANQLQEHQDWHVARTLQAEERTTLTSTSTSTRSARQASGGRSRGVVSKRANTPISSFFQRPAGKKAMETESTTMAQASRQTSRTSRAHVCSRCSADFDHPDSLQVHEDWHLATDLSGR
ncbi:sister chromatid cohesion protein [Grosmannia clavigera kw1407]|uniref:Sister chromatid cohesion protein n=1 Tax=Grosmannia clavigera (strain kw1407 / UAMH 11150) TaxID=655863 RepID=F0XBQ5_GROCL|nr:sister chromatid cohesion protein [Grosmannia clavigera kw1407]EFX05090.1 sister chromatid cohesion protein [Grosmannia clavigera kw1407]